MATGMASVRTVELRPIPVSVLCMNWREAVQSSMMRRIAGQMLQHAEVVYDTV